VAVEVGQVHGNGDVGHAGRSVSR
ncbi:MAG: hypothetical protein RL653_21, partial [Pseudomonadota bacterium]